MKTLKLIKIEDEEDLDIFLQEIKNDFYVKFSSLIAEQLDRATSRIDFDTMKFKTMHEIQDDLLTLFQESASVYGSKYDTMELTERCVTIPYDVFTTVINALESARFCDHDEVQPALKQFEQFDLFYSEVSYGH